MRTLPLLEAAVILIAGLLLVIPLIKLTSTQGGEIPSTLAGESAVASPSETGTHAESLVPTFVTIRTAHDLSDLHIQLAGNTLLQQSKPDRIIDTDWNLPLQIDPGQRNELELRVTASWVTNSPESVIEILLEPDALSSRSASTWGQDTVDDFLLFSWP